MIFHNEEIRAIAYLERDKDEKNKIMLGEQHIFVIKKNKEHSFKIDNVKELGYTHRKLLLPIVLGGVSASLSIVALFENLYAPLFIMLIFVSGIFLLYLGILGELDFFVKTNSSPAYFSVSQKSDNLKAFINFINPFLRSPEGKGKQKWLIYLVLDSRTWSQMEQNSENYLFSEQENVQALTYEQVAMRKMKEKNEKNEKVLVALDPFKVQSEIKFEKFSDNNQLYPVIYGRINKNSIDNVELLK